MAPRQGCLHVGIVNHQEQAICEWLDLAVARLPPDDLSRFVGATCTGVFFEDVPMRFYGGTVLAYGVCFDLREFVLKLLQTGAVPRV